MSVSRLEGAPHPKINYQEETKTDVVTDWQEFKGAE